MSEEALQQLKSELRRQAYARRRAHPDKDGASRQILERLQQLPQFQAAETVMFYVHARSEVRTQFALPALLRDRRRIVVPYCDGDELGLFHLTAMAQLETGTFGILEPACKLRTAKPSRIQPDTLDLIVTPGVAFDTSGGRLGYGRGYYDRLLARRRPGAAAIALAYQTQLFPEIPRSPTDVPVDAIVTEQSVVWCP